MAKPAKNRPAGKPPAGDDPPDAPPTRWRLWVRALLTLWVIWHVFVVFISPLSVSPTSRLVSMVAQHWSVRWYSDPLYLNHGYHFFGPDPPMGGNLIRYTVTGDGGEVIHQGEFPNREQQWPRLWYHRHMMLADQAAGLGVFVDPLRNRDLALRAYARHLLRRHGGAAARLESVLHVSLYPADVRGDVDPARPTDPADPSEPRFYRSEGAVEQTRSDLDTPLLPPLEASPGMPDGRGAEEVPIGVGR